MLSKEEYIKRVTVLGNYCYPDRAEETALIVFSCLKKNLSAEGNQRIQEFLPEPLNSLWKEARLDGKAFNDSDCISLAKEIGNYPYRSAAEKAFEVIFASIREIIEDDKKEKMMELLPLTLRIIFERSKSCALDGSAEEFL